LRIELRVEEGAGLLLSTLFLFEIHPYPSFDLKEGYKKIFP